MIMKVKKSIITVKKERSNRKKEKGGQIEVHVDKEKAEMKSLLPMTA